MEGMNDAASLSATALSVVLLVFKFAFRRHPPRLMFARELEALAVTTEREDARKAPKIKKDGKMTNIPPNAIDQHSPNDDLDSWPMSPAQFGVRPRS